MTFESNGFINFLNTASSLSNATKFDLKNCLSTLSVDKGDTLLQQEQIGRYLYFVNQGLLRVFYYIDGRDVTQYFATELHIVGAIESFFLQQPSRKIIEALEPCQLTALSYGDLEMLCHRHHDFERVCRMLSNQAFLSMQNRLFSVQFHSAKQRYAQLLESNPLIFQRASLGHIASYLGMTQVTLSRIRSL